MGSTPPPSGRCGSRCLGVSRAITHASAAVAQDILSEALRVAVVFAILERLYLTRPTPWLEQHLDFACLQATIFGRDVLSFSDQIGIFWRNTRRLA